VVGWVMGSGIKRKGGGVVGAGLGGAVDPREVKRTQGYSGPQGAALTLGLLIVNMWFRPSPSPRAVVGTPMICPFCGKDDDKVIDSRSSEGGRVIRRRRQCLGCSKRFTTYERVEETARLTVIKKDGSRVAFNRENILRGVLAACGKRPVAEDAKVGVVDQVEDEIHRTYDREVESRVIGGLVAERLKNLDEIAYVRFASEYYQFRNVGDIMRQLEALNERVRDVKDQQKLFEAR